MKDIRIAVRVTAKEKDKIQAKARKCGFQQRNMSSKER